MSDPPIENDQGDSLRFSGGLRSLPVLKFGYSPAHLIIILFFLSSIIIYLMAPILRSHRRSSRLAAVQPIVR